MEYILGIDMKTFLKIEDTKKLTNFIILTMKRFKDKNSVEKDYTDTYYKQLSWIRNDTVLPFTIDQLIAKLPKILPSSMCHGDFTMDNIIYKDPNFFMIDPSTGDYDSWIFDIAKLRQDLDGKWFVRSSINHDLEIDLNCIKEALKAEFPEAFNDYLYILMLLRVYKYSQYGSKEYTFLLEEIKKIWK
jgi:tRNA A-37 threonylcarbamoyl transferase component Bud32